MRNYKPDLRILKVYLLQCSNFTQASSIDSVKVVDFPVDVCRAYGVKLNRRW
ncbi:hypothetical protein [Sunxiuqinia indica]|uniref:hypothetical protein n=1 Tax=Sunxiuqinia indica TaxID=2692584 RepID=UPI00135A964A|nr:hypothetical protein [Sunxiuqinia indica]